MKLKIFVCLLLLNNAVHAQMDSTSSIEFIKDSRLDVLVKKQAQINKVSGFKSSTGQYKGFRIMVLNTNNRELAYSTKANLLQRYPDENVYMAYQSPYYKLKIGDFVKKEDAEKFKKQIVGISQSVFVIQDLIKIKPEDEARLLKEE